MSLNEKSVVKLLDQLVEIGFFDEIKLDPACSDPCFSRPKLGYAIWRWGEIEPGEHAIRTFVYEDTDGKSVLLTLVVGENEYLREVEAWRGDGSLVQSLGVAADMKLAD